MSNDANRWGVDWVRVVGNLRTAGMSLTEIADACMVAKASIVSYGSEDYRAKTRAIAKPSPNSGAHLGACAI